jgi:hypothetical protein
MQSKSISFARGQGSDQIVAGIPAQIISPRQLHHAFVGDELNSHFQLSASWVIAPPIRTGAQARPKAKPRATYFGLTQSRSRMEECWRRASKANARSLPQRERMAIALGLPIRLQTRMSCDGPFTPLFLRCRMPSGNTGQQPGSVDVDHLQLVCLDGPTAQRPRCLRRR